MRTLSLFDGISCGMIALQRAGIPVTKYYASEIDAHAEGVSYYNYPQIVRLGDVNNFDKWDLPQIDLLIGGSPCQDLSIAKANRKGLDGERSGLFWKYVDCLEKFKPKYFLLENNNSMPKEARDTISEILGVEPIMINSALVSAQLRKRLYWTNIPGVGQPTDKGIILSDIIESGFVDREKALCLTRRYAGFNGSQDYFRHRYFGKSFGQAVFEGNATPEEHKQAYKKYGKYSGAEVDGTMRQMTHIECEKLQTLPKDYTKFELINGELKETPKGARYEMIGNGWTVDVIAHILSYIKTIIQEEKY
jgi:DNA (cytosine-5)-methyltransferase 3A